MDGSRVVFLVLEWVWALLGAGCFIGAALVTLRPGSKSLPRYVSKHGRRAAIVFFGAIVPALMAAFKCAQLASHELMEDSAVAANLAWNVAHGYGPISSIGGDQSIFAFHFSFTTDLLAPFLWLWPNTAVLAISHGLAMGSVALSVFLISWDLFPSLELSWALALLSLANPLLHDVTGTFIEGGEFALPIFLWGIYFWQTKKIWPAVLMSLLMLSTREQAPILFAGMSVYTFLVARSRRGRVGSAAVGAGAILFWFFELWIMHRAEGSIPIRHLWGEYYAPLGDSAHAVLRTAVLRPWKVLWLLIHPSSKLRPVLGAFSSVVFLPLLAGPALIPLFIIWLPQQLGPGGSMFQTLAGLHAVFVLGPLFWCAVLGAERLHGRIPSRRRQYFFSVLLAAAGYYFFQTSSFGLPSGTLPTAWRLAGPKAVAAIPARASLWSDVFFAPELAMRRYIKVLPVGPTPLFQQGLFVPDRVLLSQYWLKKSDPAVSGQIMRELKDRNFQVLFEEADLVVLANPATLGKEGGEPQWLTPKL